MNRSAESFGQILPAVLESAIINFVSLFPSFAQQRGQKTFAYWVRGREGQKWMPPNHPFTIKSNLHAKEMAELSRIRIVSPLLMLNLHAAKGVRMAFRLGAFFVSLALIKLIS